MVYLHSSRNLVTNELHFFYYTLSTEMPGEKALFFVCVYVFLFTVVLLKHAVCRVTENRFSSVLLLYCCADSRVHDDVIIIENDVIMCSWLTTYMQNVGVLI